MQDFQLFYYNVFHGHDSMLSINYYNRDNWNKNIPILLFLLQ